MKYKALTFIVFLIIGCVTSPQSEDFSLENIYAWCIVPFDSLERTPQQRIEMLKELGIKKYAYDWRSEHLPYMAEELELAKENNIEIIAVWIWIDDKWDSIGALNDSNNKIFSIVEEVGYTGQVWVGFNANFFEGLTDSEAVDKGVEMITYLSKKATSLNCKIALYNHGDWFGNPLNQIKIIKALPDENIGIIYNFHHAHEQIDIFPELVTKMTPYLWHVNLNGMRREGPKILTLGKGDYERKMINLLIKEGYKGDFGILGHVEEKDVASVLKANLEGLKKIAGFDL